MLVLRAIISLLCAVGLYASVFMLRKSIRAARGEIKEPTVVKTPRGKLFFGVPNSAFGVAFYVGVLLIVWLAFGGIWLYLAVAAAALAAATSAYLAYSLLFVTRRECPFCWTSHSVNWSLLICLAISLGLR